MTNLPPQQAFELAVRLHQSGQLPQAENLYRQVLAARPEHADALANLGVLAYQCGRNDLAIDLIERAIALRPNAPKLHYNLANALTAKGDLDRAIAAYRKAISLRPNFPEAYNNLANGLKIRGELDDAEAAYRQALALNPAHADAYNNLGNVMRDMGRVTEAIAAYRRAVGLRPGYLEAHSNLVYTLQFHPGYDARAIAQALREWNRVHAEPLRKFVAPHLNDRDPERRLRIGYVSPDFRDHVVGRNLLPLFRHHDRRRFEVHCYANSSRPDLLTSQFQRHADHWRSIVGISDEQVAGQIRQDRIDILVDLTLHLAHNRLPLFARKPAPVQATFAGYPGSTGLTAIDYRLSDSFLDPPGRDESIYSETTIRLPDSFWCFDPLDCGDIEVAALPAATNGIVTFGCLGNFCKTNEGTLDLWAQVLHRAEGSRLVILAHLGSHRQRTLEYLSRRGIDPRRVDFVRPTSRRDYLCEYRRIDIGLDSFPYNGHTTSLESVWMGVPVVTLVGQSPVSRAGWCQLSNLGLTELAAHTPKEFVRIAAELAEDLPRLGELRSTLRRRMEQSPLMDAPRFAANIESAYRQMWRTWCAHPA